MEDSVARIGAGLSDNETGGDGEKTERVLCIPFSWTGALDGVGASRLRVVTLLADLEFRGWWRRAVGGSWWLMMRACFLVVSWVVARREVSTESLLGPVLRIMISFCVDWVAVVLVSVLSRRCSGSVDFCDGEGVGARWCGGGWLCWIWDALGESDR